MDETQINKQTISRCMMFIVCVVIDENPRGKNREIQVVTEYDG